MEITHVTTLVCKLVFFNNSLGSKCIVLLRWVGPDFLALGQAPGFILQAGAFSGLRNLLSKLGLSRAQALHRYIHTFSYKCINEKVGIWVFLSKKPEPPLFMLLVVGMIPEDNGIISRWTSRPVAPTPSSSTAPCSRSMNPASRSSSAPRSCQSSCQGTRA
jgi:hypothetical protein